MEQSRLLQSRDFGMNAAILTMPRPRERRNGRLRVPVHVTQQPVTFARHDRGKPFPAFKCQSALADVFAACGTMPSADKSSGVVLEASAHNHRGRPPSFVSFIISAARSLNLGEEVGHQSLRADERIPFFTLAVMAVIPLPASLS